MRFTRQIVTEIRRRVQAIPKAPIIWYFDEFVFEPVVELEISWPDLTDEFFRYKARRNLVWEPNPDLGPPVHRVVTWVPDPDLGPPKRKVIIWQPEPSLGLPVAEIEVPVVEPEPEPIPEPIPPPILPPDAIPALPDGPKWHSHLRYWKDRLIAVILSHGETWCVQCASHIPHLQLALDGGPKGQDIIITKDNRDKLLKVRTCALCLEDIR